MPSAGVTRDVAFASAPLAADNKVAVHLPATFDAAAPFVLCVFMHGLGRAVPYEDHIQQAIAQIEASSANAMLVAPRFGNDSDPGTFQDASGFSSFIAELRTVLPSLLTSPAVAEVAAAKAPIVLAAFSGGWRPLNAVLKGLLALGKADPVADRIAGIVLLDSIYGPLSSAGVVAWQKNRRAQTALLSIWGRDTPDDARASNLALIGTLKTMGPVLTPASWSDLRDFPPGTVAFFEVPTAHLSIPRDGPPAGPIAAFLSLLGDRLTTPLAV